VKKWGYPLVFNKRWCFDFLKRRLLSRFAAEERREGLQAVWVTGIRRAESQRRCEAYHSSRNIIKVGGTYVEYYHPILDWTDGQVEAFIRENGIPENPLWRLGFSFECLCMAGMSISRLDKMIEEMPELARWLAEKDKEVQEARRKGPAYVNPLVDKKIPLCEYVKARMEQKRLPEFDV
jgi:3'-phosphoadenosine 5'-phosphosulfate sulfotransferase (PAPS reductase)/FAD synthetase